MRTDFSDRFLSRLGETLKYDPRQPRDHFGRWSKWHGKAVWRKEEDIPPIARINRSWVPSEAMKAVDAIMVRGGRSLLVGGSVRDAVMGKHPKDYDFEVYGLTPDNLEAALHPVGKVNSVGKSFGVIKVRIGDVDLDLVVPRRDSKVGPGHKGFMPEPDPNMTISQAARRRDFTMNSMGMDPATGHVFDPFGGMKDIRARVIRATDELTFIEDPLRVLRGAQFAARFGMEIDPSTLKLCQNMRESLRELPVERVGVEWEKLLMKSDRPSIGLQAMRDTRALEVLHPELEELARTPQDKNWHPEGDVFEHTKLVLDEAVNLSKDLPPKARRDVIYAALMHDIAKPETTVKELDGRVTTHGHEKAGEKKARRILIDQFGLDRETVDRVAKLVGNHLAPMTLYQRRGEISDSAIRRLAKRIEPATIEELAVLSRADNFGCTSPKALARKSPEVDWLLERAKALDVDQEAPKPILMGRHLIASGMMRAGPEMGDILRRVFDLQMEGKITNLSEAMAAARSLVEESA